MCVGDKTSHGGSVLTGSPQITIDGKPVARKTDQVIVVDENTGKPQEKVPKLDDNGNLVMENGKPVMILMDYNQSFKKIPEFTFTD
ncbi:PAAR domain-containing protein [Cronobacter turicensis]